MGVQVGPRGRQSLSGKPAFANSGASRQGSGMKRGADICVTLGHLPPTWCLVCSVGLGRWRIGFLSSTLQGRAGLQVSLLSPLLAPPPQCC